MKRRMFVTGMTALAGVSALPWRQALAADGTPKPGGTLIVAYASDIHSGRFTLNREGPPGYETFWVSHNIHNQLVTLGPDYDIVPDLAKSWEVIDKGKAYVFHLHENVKFHDGTPCDAEAVKWNFDDMLKRGPSSWVYVYFNQMDAVQALDKHTVQVTMKEPAALLPALAGYFAGCPIGSPTAVDTYGEEWNRHPVGTGPFTYDINDYRPDEVIILKKNPNFFRKDEFGNALPYLDKVEIRVIKAPLAAMTALRTQQVDLLQRVNPQHVPIMERAKGIELKTVPEGRKQIAHDIQRAFAKDMLWCNITGSPYFQAYRDYVKGYYFMNQLYVRWETTWLDKA